MLSLTIKNAQSRCDPTKIGIEKVVRICNTIAIPGHQLPLLSQNLKLVILYILACCLPALGNSPLFYIATETFNDPLNRAHGIRLPCDAAGAPDLHRGDRQGHGRLAEGDEWAGLAQVPHPRGDALQEVLRQQGRGVPPVPLLYQVCSEGAVL